MNAPKPYLGLSTEQKIEFSKKYMQELKTTLDLLSQEEIGGVLETLEKAFLNGKKIFIA